MTCQSGCPTLSASDIDCITATVAASLSTSLPLYRKSSITTRDGYGHTTTGYGQIGNVSCNVIKPTETQLQLFSNIIGSQRALRLRVLEATDIQEGDEVTYQGYQWLVHSIEDAASFTVTKHALIYAVI